eukprot:m.91449 g.91449  ORF g.91449 m.91449 type:complete len:946 (-) comp20182_c0_seq1:163-3000(-)
MQDSGGVRGVSATAINPAAPTMSAAPSLEKPTTESVKSETDLNTNNTPPSHDTPDLPLSDTPSEPVAVTDADVDAIGGEESFELFSHAHRGNTVKTATGKQFKIPGSADPLDTLEKTRKNKVSSGFGSYARSVSLDNLNDLDSVDDADGAGPVSSLGDRSSSHDNILLPDRASRSRSSDTDRERTAGGETSPRLISSNLTGIRLPEDLSNLEPHTEAQPASVDNPPTEDVVDDAQTPSKKKGKKEKKAKKVKAPKASKVNVAKEPKVSKANEEAAPAKKRRFTLNFFRRAPKKKEQAAAAESAVEGETSAEAATDSSVVAADGAPADDTAKAPDGDDGEGGEEGDASKLEFAKRSLGSVSRANPLYGGDGDEATAVPPINEESESGDVVGGNVGVQDSNDKSDTANAADASAFFDSAVGKTAPLSSLAARQKSRLSTKQSSRTKRPPTNRRSIIDLENLHTPRSSNGEDGPAVTDVEDGGEDGGADADAVATPEGNGTIGETAVAADSSVLGDDDETAALMIARKRSVTSPPEVVQRRPGRGGGRGRGGRGGGGDTRRLSMGIASELNAMLGRGRGGPGGGGRPNKALLKFANEAATVRPPSENPDDDDNDVDCTDEISEPHEPRETEASSAPVTSPGVRSPGGGAPPMAFMSDLNAKLGIKKVARLPAANVNQAAPAPEPAAPPPPAEISASLAAKLPPSVLARRGIAVPPTTATDARATETKVEAVATASESAGDTPTDAPTDTNVSTNTSTSTPSEAPGQTVAATQPPAAKAELIAPVDRKLESGVSARTGSALAFIEAQRKKREFFSQDEPEVLKPPTSPLIKKGGSDALEAADEDEKDESSGRDDDDEEPESALAALAAESKSTLKKPSRFKKKKTSSDGNSSGLPSIEEQEKKAAVDAEKKAAADAIASQLELDAVRADTASNRGKSSKNLSLVLEEDE